MVCAGLTPLLVMWCLMLNQSKKVKEVLSANSFIPVHIESVQDDIDLSTTVRVPFPTSHEGRPSHRVN